MGLTISKKQKYYYFKRKIRVRVRDNPYETYIQYIIQRIRRFRGFYV